MSVEKWHRPRMYSFLINLSFNYALQSATRLDYSHKKWNWITAKFRSYQPICGYLFKVIEGWWKKEKINLHYHPHWHFFQSAACPAISWYSSSDLYPYPISWHTELDNVSAWSVHWFISMLSCSQSSPLVNGVSLCFWKALIQLTEQMGIQGRCSDNRKNPDEWFPFMKFTNGVSKNRISLQYSMAKQWYSCHTICSVTMSYLSTSKDSVLELLLGSKS